MHTHTVGMLYAWHAETRAEGCIDRTVYGALVQRPQQPRVAETQFGPESPREHKEHDALVQRPQQPRANKSRRSLRRSQSHIQSQSHRSRSNSQSQSLRSQSHNL